MYVEDQERHYLTKEKILFLLAKVIAMLTHKIIKSFCTILKLRKTEDFSCSSMRAVTSAYLISQQEMAIRSSQYFLMR